MKVKEVMTRDVTTVDVEQTAQKAAAFMLEIDAGSIPVTEGERLVGMVTDRDIAVRGVAQGYGPDTPVKDLMSSGIVAALADDEVEEVAVKMADAQVRRLPVIDAKEKLVGIVSLGDLSRLADPDAAGQALEGVSAPGLEHRQ